jgi:hypothetical protein
MDDLDDAMFPPPGEQIAKYRELRRTTESAYGRWLMLIKELRVTHDCGILEAERIALQNPHRRRWVERSINVHRECRKRALAHIRHNRERALIVRDGNSFDFHIPAP